MSDLIRELCDAINEAGATISFSKNCVSGIIGRDKCRCWRCRGVEPEAEAEAWEAEAERLTAEWRPF